MQTFLNKFLIFLVIGLFSMLCISECKRNSDKKELVKEITRLHEYAGAKYDSGFAETRVAQLTLAELQGLQLDELKKQIGKMKNLESFTEIKTTYKDSIKTYLRDSTIYDSVPVPGVPIQR